MAELHFIIPVVVLTNRQNTCNRGWVTNDLRKPAIKLHRANMYVNEVYPLV